MDWDTAAIIGLEFVVTAGAGTAWVHRQAQRTIEKFEHKIEHLDKCLHRIEDKRSEGDARLHERLDEAGKAIARIEGRLE